LRPAERTRIRRPLLAAAALAAATAALLAPAGCTPAGAQAPTTPRPWQNTALTPDQRAHVLLAAMTMQEKFSMMGGQCDPRGHTGLLAGIPRLGIPDVYFNDGPAGVHEEPAATTVNAAGQCVFLQAGEVGTGHATALPAPIAAAATFDPEMARSYGAVVGDEAAKKGNEVIFGPDVNIMRDPRGGRTFEAYGEDPYLAARMATGWIGGLQSQHVIANVKHFMANNEEDGRQSSDSQVDERTMHEIYMPAFEAAVTEAHTGSVMAAYNKVNGTYMTENGALLDGVLKRDWGFDGFVLSDYGAQHSTVGAANGGNDLELPYAQFYDPRLLTAATAAKQISIQTIDDHVLRILRTMFRFGLFDHPEYWKPAPIDFAAHGRTARSIEEQGITLLRNSGNVLPLTNTTHSIAVIGTAAGEDRSGGGSSKITADHTITPLQGITARAAANGAKVTFDDGSDPAKAAALAGKADIAIVFAYDTEGEGSDRQCVALECSSQDPDQDALIEATAQANPHTIVVLTTGSPVLMPWTDKVAGIVEAWYPGEEGGAALAATLFGDVDPSGRLPVTFPVHQSDVPANTPGQWPGSGNLGALEPLPDNTPPPTNVLPPIEISYSEGVLVGYRWYDAKGIAPLFPFGFGLSYTTFAYRNLRLLPAADGLGATVTAQITNTGRRSGADVPQLYVGMPQPTPSLVQPPRQLKGFTKLDLAPGQSQTVRFKLDQRSLSYWDAATHAWKVTPGCYGVMIGRSSSDVALRGTLAVAGASCPAAPAPPCVSRRSVLVHLLGVSAAQVRRLTVYIGGRRAQVLRGHRRSVRVTLGGRPRATVHVELVIRLADGRRLIDRRIYHTCARRHPHRLRPAHRHPRRRG
jgi:beta-glucosidase